MFEILRGGDPLWNAHNCSGVGLNTHMYVVAHVIVLQLWAELLSFLHPLYLFQGTDSSEAEEGKVRVPEEVFA